MDIAFFSAKSYEKHYFDSLNEQYGHQISYFEAHLKPSTAKLAQGFSTVCCFVNDILNSEVINELANGGTKLIALRSAGYNNVDLKAAQQHGITVVRVPAYSPYAVAEHASALILALNRKIHKAYNRIRESDFSLHGLIGFDLHDKTVGIIGTGKIGQEFARIMYGFGCHILAYDPYPVDDIQHNYNVRYCELDELYRHCDIISLHCPLTPQTHHLIGENALAKMKDGVMLINTSRGAIIDTKTVIEGLKNEKVGYLGIDVYEEEADLFFEDLSDSIITDDTFARLLTFPNVLITGHQAFFTEEALTNIAGITLANISAFEHGDTLQNRLLPDKALA